VGVHERRDRKPRAFARGTTEVTEEVDHLLGEHAVAHRATVVLGRTVRLAPDPAREAERIQAVGGPIGLNRFGDDPPVVVRGGQAVVAAGDGQVGVADVPLAPVVGLVAAGSEPVAERGHCAGIEPAHRGVIVGLGDSVGLRHTVQRRVLPGEQRRPAGHARGGADVVAVQLESAVAEAVPVRHLVPPEARHRGRLIRRGVALLVGHDDQHVRSGHAERLPRPQET